MEHHGTGLGRELRSSGKNATDAARLVAALKTDSVSADWMATLVSEALLEPRDLAMLEYARKLTLSPQTMSADDVTKLREAGFDDIGIHDICAVVAYFAFVNRIADGLGVELESGH